MTLPPPLSAADRFSNIIGSMIQSVLGRGIWLGPLVQVICGHLVRVGLRFRRLSDRMRAGKVLVQRPRRARATPPDAAQVERSAPGGPKLPRGFGWLLPLVPGAANFGSQLLYLMEDPEMAALVAASPGIQRLLRPFCLMVGVNPLPDVLKPPPRPVRPRPARQAKARSGGLPGVRPLKTVGSSAPPVPAPGGPKPPSRSAWARPQSAWVDMPVPRGRAGFSRA